MAAVAEHPKLLVLAVAVNTGQDEPPAGGLQRRAWVEELELPAQRQVHREPGESMGEVPHRGRTELGHDPLFFGPSGTHKFVRRPI